MAVSWLYFWEWSQCNPMIATAIEIYDRQGRGVPVHGTPTTTERLHELLRFLYLRAYTDERWPLHAGAKLDDLWHALILQTETYRALCDELGKFIDHRSGQITRDEMWYARFVIAYLDTFGTAPNWDIWPSPSAGDGIVPQLASADPAHDCG